MAGHVLCLPQHGTFGVVQTRACSSTQGFLANSLLSTYNGAIGRVLSSSGVILYFRYESIGYHSRGTLTLVDGCLVRFRVEQCTLGQGFA